jgi:predicted nucleic acid-binding protein
MKPTYLLDANVIVRFLANERTDQFERSKKLMAQAERGECVLILTPWILAEVIFAATSFYGADRLTTVGFLRKLIDGNGIVVPERAMVLDALDRFANKDVDFADAMLAAQCVAIKVRPASFDRDLDKFADIERYEP